MLGWTRLPRSGLAANGFLKLGHRSHRTPLNYYFLPYTVANACAVAVAKLCYYLPPLTPALLVTTSANAVVDAGEPLLSLA